VSGRAQHGLLVLADISGFTAFLAKTELEHAHDILLELLQLVVERLQPPLTVAEIEGDAVFAHGAEDTFVRGETLLELIENTYGAFHGRVEAIRLHTTCSCSACRAIPILDLKFIVHYGEYILQAVAGRSKPLGSDVNLAHRLLKNHIGESTGWNAYLLLSEPAVTRLNLGVDGLHQQIEQYEALPAVRTYSLDLRRRWQDLQRERTVRLDASDADFEVVVELPAAPAVVWDWFNDPRRRSKWIGLAVERASPPGERSGIGTRTHCTHGGKVESVHTILDWHPFDYFTEEIARPSDGRPQVVNTVALEPTSSGTRVRSRYRVLVSPRFISVPVFRHAFLPSARSTLEELRIQISSDPSPGPHPESAGAQAR